MMGAGAPDGGRMPDGSERRRREPALGLSWVCGKGWEETVLVTQLLARFTPERIWDAGREELRSWGAEEDMINSFFRSRSEFDADRVSRRIEAEDMVFFPLDDESYPSELAELPEPPAGIYVRGSRESWSRFLKAPRLTVVGTRGATPYGLRNTANVVKAACRAGVAVVSGMALGIDGRAHRETLDAGGLTVAVLGGGADVVSPPGHESLYEEILRQGVIVSEFPPGTEAEGWTFPIRNRILAALGDALMVTEAPDRSGTMITVEEANRLGRSVFAVPGSVFGSSHRGNNLLLYDGAQVMIDADWFLEDYRCLTRTLRGSRVMESGGQDETSSLPAGTDPAERLVLGALRRGTRSVDEIVAATGLAVREAAVTLATLELRGKVLRVGAGGRYALPC